MGALLRYLPTIIPLVIKAVGLVEWMIGRGNGGMKKSLVTELVKAAIMAIEGLKGKDIVDEAMFSEGVGDVVDGVVKILNSTGKFGKEE